MLRSIFLPAILLVGLLASCGRPPEAYHFNKSGVDQATLLDDVKAIEAAGAKVMQNLDRTGRATLTIHVDRDDFAKVNKVLVSLGYSQN
jgi:hypothetical protein